MKYDKEVKKIIKENIIPGLSPVIPPDPAPEGTWRTLYNLIQIADPTPVTSIPDLIYHGYMFNKKPDIENTANLILTIIFMIPYMDIFKLKNLLKSSPQNNVPIVFKDLLLQNKSTIFSIVKEKAPDLEPTVTKLYTFINK